ncbi:hypothetical protein DPMN_107825 [Dreissena polymorpha]|uniref:Uncharacterized protein n=1 Tax=Dreissena polymorpha TaxID=45954 RepID=A0A9D4QLE7_DREPO|nr:hypothetical protein DPMN_107825 [Dreissena polymorpha]
MSSYNRNTNAEVSSVLAIVISKESNTTEYIGMDVFLARYPYINLVEERMVFLMARYLSFLLQFDS